MPRNGSGTYTLPQTPFVPSTTILSAAVNSDLSDIAAALTGSVSADGQTSMTGPLRLPTGSPGAPGVFFGSTSNTGFYGLAGGIGAAVGGTQVATLTTSGWSSVSSVPVGAVQDYAGTTAPAGWQLCAGQAISRATYSVLFGVIGTTYGVGDGATTFNVPDCRGRTTYGQDNMGGSIANRITVAGGNFDGTVLGGTGGQQNSTVAQANLPAIKPAITITDPQHTHAVNASNSNGNTQTPNGTFLANSNGISGAGVSSNTIYRSTSDGTTMAATANASASTGVTAAFTSNLGSGTALPTLSNAIIFNKIIFAGV